MDREKPLIFMQEKGQSFCHAMFLDTWELELLPSFLAPQNVKRLQN